MPRKIIGHNPDGTPIYEKGTVVDSAGAGINLPVSVDQTPRVFPGDVGREFSPEEQASFGRVDSLIANTPIPQVVTPQDTTPLPIIPENAPPIITQGALRNDPSLVDQFINNPNLVAGKDYILDTDTAPQPGGLRGIGEVPKGPPAELYGAFQGLDLTGPFPTELEYRPPAEEFVSGAGQGLSASTANTAIGAAQGGAAVAGESPSPILGGGIDTRRNEEGLVTGVGPYPVAQPDPVTGIYGPPGTPGRVESFGVETQAGGGQQRVPAPITAETSTPYALPEKADTIRAKDFSDTTRARIPAIAERVGEQVAVGEKPDLSAEEFSLLGSQGLGGFFDSMKDMSPEQSDRLAEAFFRAAAGSSAEGSIPNAIGKAGMGFIDSKRKAEERDYQRALEGKKETRAEKATALAERSQGFKELMDTVKQTTDEDQFNKTYEFAIDKFYEGHTNAQELMRLDAELKKGLQQSKALLDAQARMLDIKPGEYSKIEHVVTAESADLVEKAINSLDAQADAGDQKAASKAKRLRNMMIQFEKKGEFENPAEVRTILSTASPEIQREFSKRYSNFQRAYAPGKDIALAQRYMKNAQFGRGYGGFPAQSQMEAVTLEDLITAAGSQDINDVVAYAQTTFGIPFEQAVKLVESKK